MQSAAIEPAIPWKNTEPSYTKQRQWKMKPTNRDVKGSITRERSDWLTAAPSSSHDTAAAMARLRSRAASADGA